MIHRPQSENFLSGIAFSAFVLGTILFHAVILWHTGTFAAELCQFSSPGELTRSISDPDQPKTGFSPQMTPQILKKTEL